MLFTGTIILDFLGARNTAVTKMTKIPAFFWGKEGVLYHGRRQTTKYNTKEKYIVCEMVTSAMGKTKQVKQS